MPAIRTMPRRRVTSRERAFRLQVGGQDGARDIRQARYRSGARPGPGSLSRIRFSIEFHADHAGGSGQHLVRLAASAASPAPCVVSSATSSPVRVAQLALPALIRMAPQTPFEARMLARASLTGAACTLFVVNTAAAAAARRKRSAQGRPFPACECRHKWWRICIQAVSSKGLILLICDLSFGVKSMAVGENCGRHSFAAFQLNFE